MSAFRKSEHSGFSKGLKSDFVADVPLCKIQVGCLDFPHMNNLFLNVLFIPFSALTPAMEQ